MILAQLEKFNYYFVDICLLGQYNKSINFLDRKYGDEIMLENLKFLRQKNQLTLKDMANLLGLKTASAYWKKEAGLIPFSLIEARTISIFFKKSIEYIFFSPKLSQQESTSDDERSN